MEIIKKLKKILNKIHLDNELKQINNLYIPQYTKMYQNERNKRHSKKKD